MVLTTLFAVNSSPIYLSFLMEKNKTETKNVNYNPCFFHEVIFFIYRFRVHTTSYLRVIYIWKSHHNSLTAFVRYTLFLINFNTSKLF